MFDPLVHWLGRRVHQLGGRYPAARLIEVVTGSPRDHRPLVRLLTQKYQALYQL